MTFKVQKTENTGIVYADPNDPDYTVRLKHSTSSKVLAGVQTQNQVTEIIVNDMFPLSISGVNANDAVSVRLRVSGALLSTSRKTEMAKLLMHTLDSWLDEDVLKGFNPTTVPSEPEES